MNKAVKKSRTFGPKNQAAFLLKNYNTVNGIENDKILDSLEKNNPNWMEYYQKFHIYFELKTKIIITHTIINLITGSAVIPFMLLTNNNTEIEYITKIAFATLVGSSWFIQTLNLIYAKQDKTLKLCKEMYKFQKLQTKQK